MQRLRQYRDILVGAMLGLLLMFRMLTPVVANAGAPVSVDADAPRALEYGVDTAQETSKLTLAGAVFTSLVNLMTFAANRLAYDAAVFLASGGNADEALIEARTPVDYFKDYGAAVAGEAVGQLSEQLTTAGGILSNFNLCAPSNPQILLSFRLGIRGVFDRPEPDCEITQVLSNWQGFIAQNTADISNGIFRNQVILTELAQAFDPAKNEFAVGIQLYSDILGSAQDNAYIKTQDLIAKDGVKDVVDVITGNVKTPARFIQTDYMSKQSNVLSLPSDIVIATLTNTEALLQIGISAGSVFANTLLSSLTNKLYSGLFDFDPVTDNPFDEGLTQIANRAAAQERFRSLLTVTALEVTNYNILSEFASCPGTNRGLYNCVADASFISAVARAETGAPETLEEAIENGLIDPNWPLIPSSDKARDQDPYCYTYGFCHANLVKLRKARIISIGWELAAESRQNSSGDPVTLGEVMSGYNDCNDQGELDDTHPWCQLIDPNWVLKYPDTQCRNLAYGQLLTTPAADTRAQECVDMPSCISENDDGTCTGGYGYCTVEENIWRFRGDVCPAEAASCLSFDSAEGENVNYLVNTVDYADCSEGNAGCLWYATEKTENSDGTFSWPTVDDVTTADAAADAYTTRIYLTSATETCSSDEAGCSELVLRDDELRLNTIANSSLEDDSDNDGIPDGWIFTDRAASTLDTTGTYSRTGDNAINPGSGILYQSGIGLTQGSFYTLSYYARQPDDSSSNPAEVLIALLDEDTGESIDLRGTSMTSGCAISSAGNDVLQVDGTPTNTDYERFTCTFTVPPLAEPSSDVIAYVDFMQGNVWMDDIQLEEGEDVSDYHDGYSDEDPTTVAATVPPSYLGCDGSADQPAECANYAQVCSAGDVGCMAYTPDNGDPTIFGVTGDLDVCPASCVGYDTFKQEPTRYEPLGDFPVYFIASSAETCSAEEVGCDEFTNLSDESLEYFTYLRACVTSEQAAANTSDDQEAVFYTWEGSDRDGYQLVTWNLLESDLDAFSSSVYNESAGTETLPGQAPCTTWTTDDSGISCNDDADGDGHFDTDSSTCDEHDDIFENPNCREFYDASGYIHYRDWSLTVTVDDACSSYRKTDLVGLGDDADGDGTDDGEENCTASGGYFDSGTSTCRYYGTAEESITCSESANGCREYTGGSSRNSRQVLEETFEAGDLTAWDASSAANVTYSNESVATGGHSLAITSGETVWTFLGDNGTACTDTAGCTVEGESLGGTCTVEENDQYCGSLEDELFAGKTYTVSFWAKGDGDVEIGFDLEATPSSGAAIDASFGSVELSPSTWQEYSVGPINMTEEDYPTFGAGSVLVFNPSSGSALYIDNIVIREGEDDITLIKNSWVTPAECDETPEGTASAQYYLGCAAYTTQDGDTENLKSFSSLCSENVVGCEGYFATQQSASEYAAVYGATCTMPDGSTVTTPTDCHYGTSGSAFDTSSPFLCTIGVGQSTCTFDLGWYVPANELPSHLTYGASTHVVAGDEAIYLVVDETSTCAESALGCRELGLPTFSQDRSAVTTSESVYLQDLPADYGTILCDHSELFCNAWDAGEEGTYYFKDPGAQTCEYRTDVVVNGSTYDGWFRTDTNDFCYGTCESGGTACSTDADCGSGDTCDASLGSYVVGGTTSGIWRNGDSEYKGWVGTCDSQYSTCSEFQDLLDFADDEFYGTTDGTSYYYLDNDNLEDNSLPSSQQCDGKVSQKLGCALFYNTSQSSKNYNASATYVASTHADALFGDAPFDLVDPISCDDGSAVTTITTPDGSSVDLCSQRCAYNNASLYDLSGDYTDPYTYGSSCYSNSDCVAYESEGGETVEGSCSTDVPRLEDDSNEILKVNRDRQCSEWLACSDTQTVWDERTNSYKTVCGDISLCDEYSADGSASFCSSWKDDSVAITMTAERYAERDTSWYGGEYSGYAIPDLFPVELLTQVDVAPPAGYCNMAGSSAGVDSDFQGDECSSDADCDGVSGACVLEEEQEYNLAYNAGSCDAAYGQSCTVGYCENSGQACANADECSADAGDCVIGSCYARYTSPSTCQSDSDCSVGSCIGGSCMTDIGTVPITEDDPADYCSSLSVIVSADHDKIYADSALTKAGACIRNNCLLTPDGEAFEPDAGEAKTCRAYPESNSPFPNEVVSQWKNPDTTGDESLTITSDIGEGNVETAPDLEPYDYVSGFENTKTCAAGEDCLCTYKKVVYGNGSSALYYGEDSDYPNSAIGRCSGGKFDGAYCGTTDTNYPVITIEECEGEDGGGTCEYPSREDQMIGLEGYCLERDTATNIHGNRDDDHRACITWLPVDILAGSTDLYAKYTTAGIGLTERYMCGYVDEFSDFYGSGSTVHGTYSIVRDESNVIAAACAETDDASACTNGLECTNNAACPDGYFAVMGWCAKSDSEGDGTSAELCKQSTGTNDCPYVCVPKPSTEHTSGDSYASYNIDDGTACTPEGIEAALSLTLGSRQEANFTYGGITFDNDVYTVEEYEDFDRVLEYVHKCVLSGVSDYSDYIYKTDDGSGRYDTITSGTNGFRDLHLTAFTYPACSALVEVADADGNNAAWTDRILNLHLTDDATDDYSMTGTGYTPNTTQVPFGESITPSEALGGTESVTNHSSPARLPGCRTEGTDEINNPTSIENCDGDEEYLGAAPENPNARALTSYTLSEISDWHPDEASLSVSGSLASALSRLNEIYANFVGVWGWTLAETTGTGQYASPATGVDEDDYLNEETDVRGEQGNPPKVWALDLANCAGEACEEGEENTITVNSANSGAQQGSGFFRAYAKFYAAADKNQLPIRRVIVDWQDDDEHDSGSDQEDQSGSSADDNFYKNHRGLQEGTSVSICETDSESSGYEWGMNADSCDSNYLTYSHIYTCTQADVDRMTTDGRTCDYDSEGNLTNSPCVQNGACVFRPRVHVRDNWGWCTGVCPATNPLHDSDNSSDGCFEGSVDSLASPDSSSSECAYQTLPSAIYSTVDPWVYYDGTIVVTP